MITLKQSWERKETEEDLNHLLTVDDVIDVMVEAFEEDGIDASKVNFIKKDKWLFVEHTENKEDNLVINVGDWLNN